MCLKFIDSFYMLTAATVIVLSHEEVVMILNFDFESTCNISASGSLISSDINA